MKVKIYAHPWMGETIPGVYQEGETIPGVYQEGKSHWLEVTEENLGKLLLDFAKTNDVMLLGPTSEQDYYRLCLDMKGKRFRQR